MVRYFIDRPSFKTLARADRAGLDRFCGSSPARHGTPAAILAVDGGELAIESVNLRMDCWPLLGILNDIPIGLQHPDEIEI